VSVATETSHPRFTFSFPTTHWTTFLKPIHQRTDQAQAALAQLLETYRQPIVSYVRTLARNPQDAEDIAQDFITKLLTRDHLAKADRSKGRFRSYLCVCIKNHVFDHYAGENAKKRRDLINAEPLDEAAEKSSAHPDAEKEFTRQWWRATIDEAIRRVRAEWEAADRAALFDDLEPLLWNDRGGTSINAVASKHQMTPNAVSLRKLRLLERFRETLLAVIAETVGDPREVQEEIRHLLQDP